MPRLSRVLAITGGLVLGGVFAGGMAAAFGLTLSLILAGEWRIALNPQLLRFSALVGGVIGAVVAPVTSWLFLRHVPFGRMFLQTTLATALVGGVAFALNFSPFLFAALGFLGAAARLAIVTPRHPPTSPLPPVTTQGRLGA
jgi:hypothetical protein